MLKTIKPNQVRLGMYINDLNGSWIDHPFWRTKFLLEDSDDLNKLLNSNIPSLVIDVSLGCDVAASEVQDSSLKSPEVLELITAPLEIKSTSKLRSNIEEEHVNAVMILESSKNIVTSMFQDIRLGKAVQQNVAKELVEEISSSLSRNAHALISLVRLKNVDDYTYMHSVAVCALMTALARELKLSEDQVKLAGLAGLMHDMGKAGIPTDILNKPGKLTDTEFAVIKKHPELGLKLLEQAQINDPHVLDVCLHHHEKMDGTGYPHSLSGDKVSLFAKMGAICDVYDAITSSRSYKAAWAPSQSLKQMSSWKGHFDPAIFKAFINSVGIYPVGTIVILKSDRLAVVVDQTPNNLLKPIVKVFYSTRSRTHLPVTVIDLSVQDSDEITGHTAASVWGIEDVDHLWKSSN